MSSLTTINPATGEKLKDYDLMTDQEVTEAIEQCHQAFLDWKLRSFEDRAKIINAIATELRNSKDEFAKLMTEETGKLFSDGKSEIDLCAAICEFTAENGPDELADETRDHPNGKKAIVNEDNAI